MKFNISVVDASNSYFYDTQRGSQQTKRLCSKHKQIVSQTSFCKRKDKKGMEELGHQKAMKHKESRQNNNVGVQEVLLGLLR